MTRDNPSGFNCALTRLILTRCSRQRGSRTRLWLDACICLNSSNAGGASHAGAPCCCPVKSTDCGHVCVCLPFFASCVGCCRNCARRLMPHPSLPPPLSPPLNHSPYLDRESPKPKGAKSLHPLHLYPPIIRQPTPQPKPPFRASPYAETNRTSDCSNGLACIHTYRPTPKKKVAAFSAINSPFVCVASA